MTKLAPGRANKLVRGFCYGLHAALGKSNCEITVARVDWSFNIDRVLEGGGWTDRDDDGTLAVYRGDGPHKGERCFEVYDRE